MRHKIHTPTEQFGFVETEFEHPALHIDEEQFEHEVASHKMLVGLVKGEIGLGITDTQFNHILDTYLATGTFSNGDDLFHQMNEVQQGTLQEIKKSRKRKKLDVDVNFDKNFYNT